MLFFFLVILSFLSFYSFSSFQVFNLILSKYIKLLFHFSSRQLRRCLSLLSSFVKRHYIFETYDLLVKIDGDPRDNFLLCINQLDLVFCWQTRNAYLPLILHPNKLAYARKSEIVHNNAACDLNIWLRDALCIIPTILASLPESWLTCFLVRFQRWRWLTLQYPVLIL